MHACFIVIAASYTILIHGGDHKICPSSRVNLHLFPLDFLHTDVLSNLVLGDDLLVQHRRSTPGELVVLQLLTSLVRLHEASVQRGLVFGDDGQIYVGTGAQIVEDTGLDGLGAEFHGLLLGKTGLPLGLEDGHSS